METGQERGEVVASHRPGVSPPRIYLVVVMSSLGTALINDSNAFNCVGLICYSAHMV